MPLNAAATCTPLMRTDVLFITFCSVMFRPAVSLRTDTNCCVAPALVSVAGVVGAAGTAAAVAVLELIMNVSMIARTAVSRWRRKGVMINDGIVAVWGSRA